MNLFLCFAYIDNLISYNNYQYIYLYELYSDIYNMLLFHALSICYYTFVTILYPLIVLFILWQILLLLKGIYKIGSQIVIDLTSYSSMYSRREQDLFPLDMTNNIMSRRRIQLQCRHRINRSKTL